jgi:hypothetical protein
LRETPISTSIPKKQEYRILFSRAWIVIFYHGTNWMFQFIRLLKRKARIIISNPITKNQPHTYFDFYYFYTDRRALPPNILSESWARLTLEASQFSNIKDINILHKNESTGPVV